MPKAPGLLLLTFLVVPAIAAGQNLLVNPEFDETTDSWEVSLFDGGTFGPDDDDANSCTASGSIYFNCGFSFCSGTISQCVSVDGLDGALKARAFVERISGSFLQASLVVSWYLDAVPCTTFDSQVSDFQSVPSIGTWLELSLDIGGVPAGVHWAKVEVEAENGGAMVANLDHVYFGSAAPVFAEDHELGELCRYSHHQP